MSLSGSIKFSSTATITSARDLGAASVTESLSQAISLANGTGANQANQVWGDTRALGNGANEELDLAGGLTNGLGATVTLAKVRLLAIKAAATNTDTLNVGGAAANGWATWVGDPTDVIKVRPGGILVLAAPDATGYAVTAGTGDLLKITNAAALATASYDILIIGTQA